jgi:hypothetical protein
MTEAPLVLSRNEKKDLILSVGSHRVERRLSPVEVAVLIQKALDGGWSRQEVADLLGVGLSQVAEFVRLLRLRPELREIGGWGVRSHAAEDTIPFSSLAQLSGLPEGDQGQAARAVLQYRLTWQEVVQLVQLKRRSGKSIEACIQDAVRLRPEIEVRHVYMGSIDGASLREWLGKMSQLERDSLMALTLNEMELVDVNVSGARLGVSSFVLLSKVDLAQAVGMSPDELESYVARALSRRMSQ